MGLFDNFKLKRLIDSLDVPANIKRAAKYSALSILNYYKYHLEDKLPVTCINQQERQFIERFGIENAKKLDWELISKVRILGAHDLYDVVKKTQGPAEEVNEKVYAIAKDLLEPGYYTPLMKNRFPNSFFEISDEERINGLEQENVLTKDSYNNNRLSFERIIDNWAILKDMDLSFYIKKFNLNCSEDNFKVFVNENVGLIDLLNNTYGLGVDPKEVISNYFTFESEDEKEKYLSQIVDIIINYCVDKEYPISNNNMLSLFKHKSFEEVLRQKVNNDTFVDSLLSQLNNLPEDFLNNCNIPIIDLFNINVLDVISRYGIKNIDDFDKENDKIFTKDNSKLLKRFESDFLHYRSMDIIEKNYNYVDGKFISHPHTKEEFNEVIRNLVIVGPNSRNKKAIDFDSCKESSFRDNNSDLFLSKDAPLELKEMYYSHNLTPIFLNHNKEDAYKYLSNHNLAKRFSFNNSFSFDIRDKEGIRRTEYVFDHLYNSYDYNEVLSFIVEYGEVLDVLTSYYQDSDIKINEDFSFENVKKSLLERYKKLLIEKNLRISNNFPDEMKKIMPDMFLRSDAPEELKKAFREKKLNCEDILNNPIYQEYLRDIDVELMFNYIPFFERGVGYNCRNLIGTIKEKFGQDAFNMLLKYGPFIERAYEVHSFDTFNYRNNFSQVELINSIEDQLEKAIVTGSMKYSENMPDHFILTHPTLFLNKNIADQKFRDKFYNKEFTLADITNDEENFIRCMGQTNVALAFGETLSWIAPLFRGEKDQQEANKKRLAIIKEYLKVEDYLLQNDFVDYVKEMGDEIDLDKVHLIANILNRLAFTNSTEMFALRKNLSRELLAVSDPIDSLNKIEELFLKNNVPTVGKIYSCFEILHPNFEGFNIDNNDTVSPTLKNLSSHGRQYITFADLLKSAMGSNNRSLKEYFDNLEIGSRLYNSIKNNQIIYEDLLEEEKKELETFANHLTTLYNRSLKGRIENKSIDSKDNVIERINMLSQILSPNGTTEYDLGNRAVAMFCQPLGIETVKEAKDYMKKKVLEAERRNKLTAQGTVSLRKGDIIKGIGSIQYLGSMLNNGINSKEYLGANATRDLTVLDTDICIILDDYGSIQSNINATPTKEYGPIYFVLKNDDRFRLTRNDEQTFEENISRDESQYELFYTGVLGKEHYGIRTGFASSDIDYILVSNYDSRIGLEIAMNGFYIPVFDMNGKILFTEKDYEDLRAKMAGLEFYGEKKYNISNNLTNPLVEETKQVCMSDYSRTKDSLAYIQERISIALRKAGIDKIHNGFNKDLVPNLAEIYSTGSTARCTNVPGDSDFDFLIKIDREIFESIDKLNKFKEILKEELELSDGFGGKICGTMKSKNNEDLDIEISFCPRTDKVELSTDTSLEARLEEIKKQYPDKYDDVIANIVLAKQIMKKGNVYKSAKSDSAQGGLGGIGIENWILQNGGSLVDATKSFLKVARDYPNFEDFKEHYQIFDFGSNHYIEKDSIYPHDNFVFDGDRKMTPEGFKKMKYVLEELTKSLDIDIDLDNNQELEQEEYISRRK